MSMERDLEGISQRVAKHYGFLTIKLNIWGNVGWPDRLFVGHGHCFFIEYKSPKEKLTLVQSHIHRKIEEHGVAVYVVRSLGELHDILSRHAKKGRLEVLGRTHD